MLHQSIVYSPILSEIRQEFQKNNSLKTQFLDCPKKFFSGNKNYFFQQPTFYCYSAHKRAYFDGRVHKKMQKPFQNAQQQCILLYLYIYFESVTLQNSFGWRRKKVLIPELSNLIQSINMPWKAGLSEKKAPSNEATQSPEPELIFYQTPQAQKKSSEYDLFSIYKEPIIKKLDWEEQFLMLSPVVNQNEGSQSKFMFVPQTFSSMPLNENLDDTPKNHDSTDEKIDKQIEKTPPSFFPQTCERNSSLQNLLLFELNKSYKPEQEVKIKCNCRKSHCLKMYCQCFKSGQVCNQECNCCDCENKEEKSNKRSNAINHIINKDYTAFLEKVPYNGCKCEKSRCRKKYCECFARGLTCGKSCRCIDCKNKVRRPQKHRKKNLK